MKMTNLLQDKTILVVGAGGILGSAIVKSALEAGAFVIAADINPENTDRRLESLGINISSQKLNSIKLDITQENSVKSFFEETERVIDGAVNASYPRNSSYGAGFFDVSLESFNENLALHLGSTFLFTQQSAAYFKRNQSSYTLVNISSIYGVIAPKFDIYDGTTMTMPIEYAAIKSAILHLNKYVNTYVSDSKFRVNSVSPGGILDSQPDLFLKKYKENTFGKGMLDVCDVVGSVLFLLSDTSRFVTGQNIIVDDGFSL